MSRPQWNMRLSKKFYYVKINRFTWWTVSTCQFFRYPRFSVSTVEPESKKNGIHMGASIISRPLRNSAETVERGVAVVAPNAQPDTWLHDAGWRRKRSLAQLTREALPRMENYRNSKRALKRPSLGELHGDHLITEEVWKFTIFFVKI